MNCCPREASDRERSTFGQVSDWVRVRYNEARYGRDCDVNGVCTSEFMWELVKDAANQWVADQRAAGRTDVQIKVDLGSLRLRLRRPLQGARRLPRSLPDRACR
ncbi:hypothetical protein Abr02nite_84040 [Paractinoplanes brasiliensis]|nr:hypothetical protein Abr02nite_84040 [Actinoplanes brasiliensis]